jgi:N12 class adenine-specific DNA methylase
MARKMSQSSRDKLNAYYDEIGVKRNDREDEGKPSPSSAASNPSTATNSSSGATTSKRKMSQESRDKLNAYYSRVGAAAPTYTPTKEDDKAQTSSSAADTNKTNPFSEVWRGFTDFWWYGRGDAYDAVTKANQIYDTKFEEDKKAVEEYKQKELDKWLVTETEADARVSTEKTKLSTKAADIAALETTLSTMAAEFEQTRDPAKYSAYEVKYNEYEKAIADYEKSVAAYTELWNNVAQEKIAGRKTDDSGWETAGKTLWAGVTGLSDAVGKTLDYVFPTEFLGKYDPFTWMSDQARRENYDAQMALSESLEGRGWVAKTASELGIGLIQMLPDVAATVASGGTNATTYVDDLYRAGSSAVAAANKADNLWDSFKTANAKMFSNPGFYVAAARTLGTDYETAKEAGATDAQATAYALITTYLNAGIEISGGIQALPDALQTGDKSAILDWILSAHEEGLEEVVQRFVSGSMEKAVYDPDKEWFSTTNEDAIIHPETMAKDYGMGTAIGGIAGGGQTVAISVLNRIAQAKTPDVQAQVIDAVRHDPETVNALVQEAKTAGETEITEQVEQKIASGEEVTRQEVVQLVAASGAQVQEETTEAATEPEAQTVPQQEEPATEVKRSESLAEEMTLEGAVENGTVTEAAVDTEGATRNGVAVLTNYAKQAHMGENGLKAIADFYDANENPETAPFYGTFAAYWNAGYNGKAFEEVRATNRGNVSDVVMRAAYNAGQMDAIQGSGKKAVDKTAGQTDNISGKTQKTAKPKTVRTQKSDWSAHDVTWTLPAGSPNKATVVAYSTKATSDTIDVMADENPTATISQLRDLILYDQDAKKVLQQYIDAGYGDQVASEWFSYDRKRGIGKPVTKWVSGVINTEADNKEATEHGKETLGEVSDEGRVLEPDTRGADAGGLLDGVASQNVQENAEGRDAVSDAERGRGTPVGAVVGTDAGAQVPRGRSDGIHQGRSVRTSSGVSEQEVNDDGDVEGNYRKDQASTAGSERTVGEDATGGEEAPAGRIREKSGGTDPDTGLSDEDPHPWATKNAVEPEPGSISAEAKHEAESYDVKCVVVSDDAWDANHPSAQAFSRNGVVYAREHIDEVFRGVVAPHELTHVMKQLGYKPYLDFLDRTSDMLNYEIEDAQALMQHVAEHARIDLFGMDESASQKLYDELNASVYGHIVRGDVEGKSRFGHVDFRDAFNDFDAYATELAEIHRQFKNRNHPGASDTVAQEQIEQISDLANQEEPKGTNFVIGANGAKMPTTPKARYKANADAIKTLRAIMAENRMATPQEQETLSKYTGWGGLSDVFNEKNESWAKEYKQLKKLLDDGEYKTAKGSILDAYYTDPSVIRGMYNGLASLGFTGGRMLEPSSGVGRFIGAMPQEMLGGVKSWTAVELDKITGNIAKYLYPNADVRVQGYETAKIPDGYMDVVIGNVPFGNIPIADKAYPASVTKSIHNYFIAKSLDKLRPGGIAAIITSSGTLDAMGTEARSYFMKQADLIGAIRLPNTAFEGTGTNVVSDILVFKKREPGTAYKGEAFIEVGRKPWTGENQWGGYEINEYFLKHPEMVLGTAAYGKGQYGRNVVTYNPLDSRLSLQKQIEKAFGKIKAKMDYPVQRTQEEIRAEIREASGKVKQGGLVSKGGKLYRNNGGVLEHAAEISEKDAAAVTSILEIRDAARNLLNLQIDDGGEAAITAARSNLNKLYDAFVKKYGSLNLPKNKKLVQNDVDSPFILALEDYNNETRVAKKAAIFSKNTITATKVVTHADTVEEALTVSLNETGTVDIQRIAQLTGQQAAAVEREMLERGLAFKNRNGNLETAETYLSGNVRAKLRDAEALAEGDADYNRNVEALKKVIPADIPAEEIKVRPGATWIPDSIYSAFAGEMLGGAGMTWRSGQRVPAVEVVYNRAVGKFFIEVNDPWLKSRPENTSTWGTSDRPFVGGQNSILEAALNNKMVSVYRTVGDSRVLDKQATAAAQEKLEKVLAEFQSWIWKDEARRTELGGLYNEVFNNTVTPKYDGTHLTVIGSNPEKPMRPHQKNAVQRVINSGGNTLLAHRVGAGKTYEMAAAAMKLRQLGIIKKPLFVVPKHLVAQWDSEFRDFFPAAKILPLEHKDFTPANRKLFANRIATGDYDAVIMSYEQFGMVPMSQEHQEAFYQEQIDALEMAILESKRASGKRDPSVRDMERSKKTFETKLKKLGDGKKDVDNINFEQLGIDALFVDEAHNFKNLFYNTKMQGVADLGDKDGSMRAFDLYMKVRYLQRLNGGRGIVFATATPVMNSVVELYTMQRYLQGDLLDAKGLTNFDAWANQFGDVVTIRKMKTGGNGYELKQSLSKYKNLSEMQQMFRSFADVITDAADLPYLKIPKMKGGKRIVVECEPSAFQEQFMEELGQRAEALRGAGKGGSEDHIFKVFDDGKKISFTQRMIDSDLPYEDGGKIMKCAENVLEIWKRTKANKGTQLIFCDRGTPGGAEAQRGVSLYEDVKNLLVAGGVPANQVAFIHDADTEEAKSKLFKDVKAGNVRVLIGSTAKMGTGMNVQDRIVAMHELNAPDRPGDLEQNEGRALRQGNMNEEVEVYAYVTKKTFDSRQWDNLKRKATFIHQIMAGEYNGREADGDGDLALSAAEISAIASDNPLIMEQFEVSEKISNLENLERAHTKEVAEAKRRIATAEKEIESDTEYLERYKKDRESRQETAGDKFRASIGGKTFAERKAAGEALIAAAKRTLNLSAEAETYTEVGSFAGFKLFVTSKGDMILRGKAQYRGTVNMQSAVGTIQALEAIPKRIDAIISATETRLAENKAAITKLRKTAASSFDKAEELIAARVREAEIMAELNPPSEQQMAALDDGDDVDNDVSSVADAERWTAKRVGGSEKAPKSLSEIVEQIRQDFGVHITTGHVRGKGTRGQYNHQNQGIRTKVANNLPTIAHELGHHLTQKYNLLSGLEASVKTELEDALGEGKENYPEKKWHSEGFAEYLRKFLQNRETAAIDYPEVTKLFLNALSGKDRAQLEELADEVNAYYSLDADTATSAIRLREEGAPDARTVSQKIRAKMSALYQAWVDSNEGIKQFDRATGANTYKIASNAAYADAIAGQIITGDLTGTNGQYVGPGLKTALYGLDMNNKQEYRLFGEYLTVKHGPERLAEGMRIFADDRKNSTGWMQRRQAELEAQYPQFAEISDRLYEFITAFHEAWGVETGLIGEDTFEEWKVRWQHYVPLNRAVGVGNRGIGAKRGFANQTSTINKARGSGLDIVHPVDNLINNIVKMVSAGVRNNVMATITEQATQLGANAMFLEKVPMPLKVTKVDMTGVKDQLTEMLEGSDLDAKSKAKAGEVVSNLDDILFQYGRGKAYGDVVTVLKDGKPEFWKINDPQLLSSITNMAPKTMDGILDAYAVVSRFMTSNITGNNVIWSLFSNFPRDMMTFFTYSKDKNPKRMIKGVSDAFINRAKGDKADPLYKEFLAMGGGKTSAYTADRDLAKRAREKLSGKKINANPLDWIAYVSDTIENGPRYATYKLMRDHGMNPQEAFYEAMDITVNFRRGGRIARELNKVVPFFNANVQGLDKFRRWITAEGVPAEHRKKVIKTRTTYYVAASAALAAMIYALNMGSGEREKEYEQLSTYTKNSFWCIPLGDGKFFAIPKPREIGVLSSFFESTLEYVIGENDHAFDDFYSYAMENCLPSIANDIAQIPNKGLVETGMNIIGSFGVIGVIGYLGANRDFLGRPIVSSGLQNLEPKDQYTERTSKIAYWLGQAYGGSPQQIDYFFQQVLGGWWKAQKALFPVGQENVDYTLGVQNTYVKDNQYSTDLTNWLYDRKDATSRANASDPANMEKAISAKWDSNMTDFYGSYYKLAKNKAETVATRSTRQLVLEMILEYQKAIDTNAKTETQRAVEEVCTSKSSTEFLPSVMPVEVTDGKGVKHVLSDIQYVEFQTDYNRLYWEIVEETLSGNVNERAEILKAAKRVAKEEAVERVLARIGAPKSAYTTTYGNVSADNVTEFLASVSAADDDGSVKQAEVIDIITGMGLSDSDAWTLYFSKYDGKAATAAEEHGIPAELFMNTKLELDNIKPDYRSDGTVIRDSRRRKVESYLATVCSDYKEYLFFLGMEFSSVKDDADYIAYFGREDD